MTKRLSPERIAELFECLRFLGVEFVDELLGHIEAIKAELQASRQEYRDARKAIDINVETMRFLADAKSTAERELAEAKAEIARLTNELHEKLGDAAQLKADREGLL